MKEQVPDNTGRDDHEKTVEKDGHRPKQRVKGAQAAAGSRRELACIIRAKRGAGARIIEPDQKRDVGDKPRLAELTVGGKKRRGEADWRI